MSAGQAPALAHIETFFTPPEDVDAKEGRHSVLCQLRREIQECLVDADPQPEAALLRALSDPTRTPEVRRLFASTMLTLGGIDLLAKFLDGRDTHRPGEVGCRFERFVRRYMGRAGPEAPSALYAVRNTLMHSFGLYDTRTRRWIQLTAGAPLAPTTPAVSGAVGAWQVDVLALYRDFVDAIGDYRAALRGDTGSMPIGTSPSLQDRFAGMYPRYGTLVVR
jgi:hypothetical protein